MHKGEISLRTERGLGLRHGCDCVMSESRGFWLSDCVFFFFFLCVCFISHSDIILRVCNRLTDMKWRWNEEEGDGVGEGEAMDR